MSKNLSCQQKTAAEKEVLATSPKTVSKERQAQNKARPQKRPGKQN